MLSFRDPVHGFIRADELEAALVSSRPMQRLRFIRQLGPTFLVFPGAEHSRFSHVLGTMHLAGRVYDALAEKSDGLLPEGRAALPRRLVRIAALLHDVGHAPFSHAAEDLFDEPIDHEEMTRRLLGLPEVLDIFADLGNGLEPAAVIRVLAKDGADPVESMLAEIVSSELDVDKMDYLQRDSLYCGVGYGRFDLERLLDRLVPLRDEETGRWRIAVDHGGVHALEAMVLARYYMFTQVYFNATGKVMELHYNEWLREEGWTWPSDPEAFLHHDDVTVLGAMQRSPNRHARALLDRRRYRLAFETAEHLGPREREGFATLVEELRERWDRRILVDHSSKDPHRLGASRMSVRRFDGTLQAVSEASDFIAHMSPIDCFRVYADPGVRDEVTADVRRSWNPTSDTP